MMKIIWITSECPYPPNTGGRVGIWKRIEYFSRKNDIYLFSIYDYVEEKNYEKEMLNWCKEVYMYRRVHNIKGLLKTINNPYPAVSRWNKEMKNKIEEIFQEITPDYVMVDGPQMLGVVDKNILKSKKVILNEHNIEHLALKSIGEGVENMLKKVMYKITSFQMKKYEHKIYKKNEVCLYTFVSSKDKDYFEKEYGLVNTYLVPVGAEYEESDSLNNNHVMVFVAKMSYQSNEDGAIWLVQHIWDNVIQKIPDAKLYLVGKDPSEKLIEKAKEHDGVIVTGTVENLKKYYDMTNLVVVPIFSGGGVKVKLLEALGYGKIVVTTQKGIEGTRFADKKELLVANNVEDFSEKCVKVMRNPREYNTIRNNAKKMIEDEYSWEKIISCFEEKLIALKGDLE